MAAAAGGASPSTPATTEDCCLVRTYVSAGQPKPLVMNIFSLLWNDIEAPDPHNRGIAPSHARGEGAQLQAISPAMIPTSSPLPW